MISIHALLAESDGCFGTVTLTDFLFLSTLSLRRATVIVGFFFLVFVQFLSTLSLRRATQALSVTGSESQFLSTLSLRRATVSIHFGAPPNKYISIHALLAESDWRIPQNQLSANGNFYPRSPCGERHRWPGTTQWVYYFYPRSPCGERPRSGSSTMIKPDFYPRSPCGERRCFGTVTLTDFLFLSTLSLRRATRPYCPQSRPLLFLSTLSLRRATLSLSIV